MSHLRAPYAEADAATDMRVDAAAASVTFPFRYRLEGAGQQSAPQPLSAQLTEQAAALAARLVTE